MEDLPDPLAATRRQNRGNDSFKRPSQGPYKRGYGPSGRINGKHFVTASPQDRHGLKNKAYPRNSEGIIKVPQENKLKGKPKLKKWRCLCGQTARVGREEFYAICTLCEGEFVLAE
jgi:hypothetical protein